MVSGGQLNLTETGASSSNSLFVTVPTTEELLIKGDITKLTAGGDENVGLVIGDNRLVFHPGFSGGAFRVEGAGGFGNQNMGFTPGAFPTFHAFEIQVTTVGEFEIKVTDGDNSSNVYTASFTNPSYTPGELIGFTTRGSNLGRVGVFDNLQISTIESASVPEPKTLLSLLTVGGLGLAMKRKKHSEKRHGSTMG